LAAVTLLQTLDLRRSFGGLNAVDGVNFTLSKGEIRAVIGPNGAGKTTFVSLIAGRLAPSSGEIIFRSENITKLPAHARVNRGIAYTFQITSIYPNLTVAENVGLADHSGREAMRCLERVGLANRADQKASTLAYGHQRLLEVAMGMALRPKLLILDEPTQGLSDSEIADFIALVQFIALDATVMLIEHNIHVVMALATRVTVMAQGRILAEGTPEDIRTDRAVQDAYLGTQRADA
jgi:branched-chain amino acid transport system ATP-binding protein